MLRLNKIQLGTIKPGLTLNKVHTCVSELLNSGVDWVTLIVVLKLLALEKRAENEGILLSSALLSPVRHHENSSVENSFSPPIPSKVRAI